MACYYYKTLQFEKGIFDNIIDCTFILTMENSNRDPLTKIKETPTSKKVIIQYNKGYKKCKKQLVEQKSHCDLAEAYFTVFKYANKYNMNNILVLEDDFIFNKKINNKEVIENITNLYKENNVNIFQLGTLSYFLKPNSIFYKKYNCFKLIVCHCAHAIIYNKKFRDMFINIYRNNKKKCKHFDTYLNMLYTNDIYTYRYPLAYQLFPETENSKNWVDNYGKLLDKPVKRLIKYYKLNESTKEWKNIYSKFYIINIFVYVCIIIFIIFLFIKLNKLDT